MIRYEMGNDLDPDVFIELYHASTLGRRRPVGERERMTAMLRNANLMVTAWEGERLVGLARSLTDFTYATYVADLAVRESHQRMGIGIELLRRTQEAGAPAMLVLLAAPAAVDYYPGIGFERHGSAWTLPTHRKPGKLG
jgi:predicted N-acetyltransferase YhbS